MKKVIINQTNLKNAHHMLHLLLRKNSKRIMSVIGPMGATVTDIMISLRDVEQSSISYYLSLLSQYNIVHCEIEGHFRRYFINKQKIRKINNDLQKAKESGVIS